MCLGLGPWLVSGQAVDAWRGENTTGGLFVDGTFGAGGHSAHLLNTDPQAHVLGIDRDEEVGTTASRCAGAGAGVGAGAGAGAGVGAVRGSDEVGGLCGDSCLDTLQHGGAASLVTD